MSVHFYRLLIGLAVIGISSMILNFIFWIFEDTYGAKLLIPGFVLLFIGSYLMGLYVENVNRFLSGFKKESNE